MRWGVLLLCLAACYDDAPGARLVIKDPGFGAQKVELFLATRSANTSTIGANQARNGETRAKLRGDSFFLDGPGDGITPITELPIVDGQVVWNLQADENGPRKAKLVVAVAYDAQGVAVATAKMHDLEIPTNDAVAYVLTLEEAKQIEPSESMEPAGVRVWPWRKANEPRTAACLGLEHSDGLDHLQRIWLVPEDDPDCDEVQLECDEHLYRADYSEDATACVVPASTSGPTSVPCKLGQMSCQDEVSAGGCTPLTAPSYCIAKALCDADACLADVNACRAIDSSQVNCELPSNENLDVCPDPAMGSGPLEVNLTASSGLFPGGCQSVLFASQSTGLISSQTTVVADATFVITQFSSLACSFQIEVNGPFNATAATGPLLLVLDVTRGGAHYLVPLFIKVAPATCDDRAPSCTATRGSTIDLGLCQ